MHLSAPPTLTATKLIARDVYKRQEQVRRYRARVSGPLVDRIDLHIEVPRLAHRVLRGDVAEESSATVRARVCAARDLSLIHI